MLRYLLSRMAPQQVSADHFLRAETEAIKNLASSTAEVREAAGIYLAGLSSAFLQQCRDLQDFAKQCASKQLQIHMFGTECHRALQNQPLMGASKPARDQRYPPSSSSYSTTGTRPAEPIPSASSSLLSGPARNCLQHRSLARGRLGVARSLRVVARQ